MDSPSSQRIWPWISEWWLLLWLVVIQAAGSSWSYKREAKSNKSVHSRSVWIETPHYGFIIVWIACRNYYLELVDVLWKIFVTTWMWNNLRSTKKPSCEMDHAKANVFGVRWCHQWLKEQQYRLLLNTSAKLSSKFSSLWMLSSIKTIYVQNI